MNTLLTVFTWAGQRDQVDRHYPTWEGKGADILLVSPEDAPSHRGGIVHGKSQKYGSELMGRILHGMTHALSLPYDSFVFTEGDSVVLRPIPEQPPTDYAFCCYAYTNTDPRFRASCYAHFAWWMSRDVLERVTKAMRLYALGMEQGFADRVMAWILEQEKIYIRHSRKEIYSANEIDAEDKWNEIEKYRDSLIFVHGIKTEEQFKRIQSICATRADTYCLPED